MLDVLEQVLEVLPVMLEDENIWESLIINRRKPHTFRIFTPYGENRVCLHRFDSCDIGESFAHPHPWPGAFKILKGQYHMMVGWSQDLVSLPLTVLRVNLDEGSSYEIKDPRTWHSVTPKMETYTVMVNGPPFQHPHRDIRTTKGKDLEKLSQEELRVHLAKFKELLRC